MGKKDGMTYANEMFDEISRALAIEKGHIKDTKMPDQPSLSALRKSLDKAVAAYRKFRSHL
ncbi:2501_t:CDS:2 [Rhizophagus irregularis]|nr:2501_t:CDS:2 [Rhizophagus irregularis]